jgi:DIS3-like exonuclease 1
MEEYLQSIHLLSPVQVHRQLLSCVEGSAGDAEVPGNVALESMARHMNSRHRAAQDAQRASLELFQALYFRQHGARTDVCTADAVVLTLRSNGLIVFVPR